MAITFSFTVTSPKPPEEVFDYLADFHNLPHWDPETDVVEMSTEGAAARVGARFTVRVKRSLWDVAMDYEVIELDRPRQVAARGTASGVTGVDTYTVSPAGQGGSEVVYHTEIELTGVAKLTRPVAGSAVRASGEKTRAGLERALNP